MTATLLRVLVQGAGIGGLTAAIALAEGMKAVVRVVESRSRLETAHKHEYVGLWSPALRCLHDLGIYPHLRDHMQFVGETSYRSTTGEVLATPQIGLSPFDEHRRGDQSSLGFINKRILMEVLRKAAAERGVEVEYSASILGHSEVEMREALMGTDLCLGADGAKSAARQLLFPSSHHPLVYRGYKVYRGHSWTNRHPHETTGFQTWGAGARFASVPTLSGNCWFAAITERNYAGPDYGSSGSSSRGSSNDMIGYLLDRFKGWHSPIRELIHLTEDGADGIQFDYAHAFDAVYKRSYGMLSRIDGKASEKDGDVTTGVHLCLVGDAAYTLDPILAQGAGLAVEDAFFLVQELQKVDRDSGNLDSKSIMQAIRRFDASRHARRRRVHFLSDASQIVGHVNSPILIKLRNTAIQAVPRRMKGYFFEKALRYSIEN